MPVPKDMDNGNGDWLVTWWAPISFVIGGFLTYLGTLLTLRRQFLDHLESDTRIQAELADRLDHMHSENKDRLDNIDDDIRELRAILLNRYRGPEKGH